MLNELNKELTKVKEKMREKERLTLRHRDLKKELENEKKKLEELRKILNKEHRDVEKLESLSIGGLIYALLGKKEEKLEKEKEEYILAKIKYDEKNASVSYLEMDVKKIKDRLKSFVDLEEQYENIIKKKEENIFINDIEIRMRLEGIEKKILDSKADIKELSEAISAGHNLLDVIRTLVDALNSASSWGTFDMLGGGILSTAIKHNHIDEAKNYSYEVKEYMRRFQRELKDVNRELNLDVKI